MDLMTISWYTTKTEQIKFDKLTFIETSFPFLIPYQICTNIEEWYLYSFEYILLFNAKILTHNLLFRNKRFIIFHFASLGSVMKYVRTFELFWCFSCWFLVVLSFTYIQTNINSPRIMWNSMENIPCIIWTIYRYVWVFINMNTHF